MRCDELVSRLVLMGSLLLVTTSGCGYGEVHPQAYQYSKALYSICNRQDAARLDRIVSGVQRDLAGGQLSEQEAEWLMDIVNKAQHGDWKRASQAARRIMVDQI